MLTAIALDFSTLAWFGVALIAVILVALVVLAKRAPDEEAISRRQDAPGKGLLLDMPLTVEEARTLDQLEAVELPKTDNDALRREGSDR
jgi:hypothetical protein